MNKKEELLEKLGTKFPQTFMIMNDLKETIDIGTSKKLTLETMTKLCSFISELGYNRVEIFGYKWYLVFRLFP